jgi:hypothetical protein
LKTHLTAKMVEEIVQQEAQVREKVEMTSDILQKNWQHGSRPEVARDEPHVSVGGLLEQAILDKSWESHRTDHDILAKEKCAQKQLEHVRESARKRKKVVRILGTLCPPCNHFVMGLALL